MNCPSCGSSKIKFIHIHEIYVCFDCDDNFTKEMVVKKPETFTEAVENLSKAWDAFTDEVIKEFERIFK